MSRDGDGFADIADYAAIGDCRSVALVASDGRIDWWPVVDADAVPSFAALIDSESGGRIELAPAVPYQVRREYVANTNVLDTTFVTAQGLVRVRDLIPLGRNGNLAWSELVRQVECLHGAVPMRWMVWPGDQFRRSKPRVIVGPGGPCIAVGDELIAVRAFGIGEVEVGPDHVGGSFVASPGATGTLALVGARSSPVFLVEPDEVDDHVVLSIERWQDWTASIRYDGPWADAVTRSALALKLLTSIQTGAILAAPTTSLPEWIGGSKNWDYRYMWVRDASFTIDAFLALGLHAETQAAVQWLLSAVRSTAPELKTLYRLSGELPDPELIVPLPGYCGSRPVRCGNSAVHQLQLGNFGDLFDTVAQYVDAGHRLDDQNGRMLAELADRCCVMWMFEDSGIWELETRRHYTISKVGCWVALDRALRLADADQIPDDHADRWSDVRDEVKSWVDEHCWSSARNCYVGYAGGDDLDAATLLLARTGFDHGERMIATIAAIDDELGAGPYIYRYSGVASEEGAFLACSFWMVHALALTGDLAAAQDRMEQAVSLCNDVGLMAEQVDSSTGAMLGNFPQGLSHLALINAASAIARLSGERHTNAI